MVMLGEGEEDEQHETPPLAPVEDNTSLRRSIRERQLSKRYSLNEFVLLTDGGEPESFQEAMSNDQKGKWLSTMHKEMKSLLKNHTYELVKLPKGKRALKNKWVYKLKIED